MIDKDNDNEIQIDTFLNSSKIISKDTDANILSVYEALCILSYRPSMNQQADYLARRCIIFSFIPTNETLNLDRSNVP